MQKYQGRSADTCTRVPPNSEAEMGWCNRSYCSCIGIRAGKHESNPFIYASQSSTFGTDDPKSSCTSHENLLSVGSKRKLPRDSEDLLARQIRWKRINGDRGQQHRQHGPPTTEINCHSLPVRDASATWILCPWGNPLCSSLF